MSNPLPEKDWKYLRGIQGEMLNVLCARINRRAADITAAKGKNPHEKYLELYRHIQESDGIIVDCFDDWRRSKINERIKCLRRNGLLTDEHILHMTPEAQARIQENAADEVGDSAPDF